MGGISHGSATLLLGGDVALDFSEFLFESIYPGPNRFLLGHRCGNERTQQALIEDSTFLGAGLECLYVLFVQIDGNSHLVFPERLANGVGAYAVNLEISKVWLFHDRASETFSIRRNQ